MLKLGRGDLFGILIPGAFLVLVAAVLFVPELQYAFEQLGEGSESLTGGGTVAASLVALVASYVTGYGLRLLPPELVDRRSRRRYPYFSEVHDWHLKRRLPRTVRSAITEYLKEEYGPHYTRELERDNAGKTFINFTKLQIYHRSEALRSEMLYCESVSRLAIGMCQAIWIGVVLHLVRVAVAVAETQIQGTPAELFSTNAHAQMWAWGLVSLACCLGLAPIFFLRVREARYKEVATVLHSLGTLLLEDEREQRRGRGARRAGLRLRSGRQRAS